MLARVGWSVRNSTLKNAWHNSVGPNDPDGLKAILDKYSRIDDKINAGFCGPLIVFFVWTQFGSDFCWYFKTPVKPGVPSDPVMKINRD